MKRNAGLLLIIVCLAVVGSLHAQTAGAVFDPNTQLTWLGLDFSQAKLVGDADKFTQANNARNLLGAWNDLLLKEAQKYNVRDAFVKRNVNNDFTFTKQHNEGIDFQSLVAVNPGPELERSAIRAIVAGYDFGNLNGLGVMLIVEKFDKSSAQGACWVTFINLQNRQVIFTERKTGAPVGAGIRNYWAGSILHILESCGKHELASWKRKYPESYTEAPYDGPSLPAVASNVPAPVSTTPKPSRVAEKKPAAGQKTEPADKTIKPGGKYYALLIGVSQYQDARLNLDQPVADARKVKELLTQGYEFNSANTILLENPTRGEIFSALYKLRTVVTASDNLLIFYAGHGYWDEKINQGYWWPRDANSSDPSNWLSNSDLREQLRGITSAHTLLISDACFSGGLFRTRDASQSIKNASIDYQMLYKMPSRRAITSGTLTAVPDRSVFVEYLLKRLGQNKEKFLPSQSLFSSIRLAIINNSATVPQEGVIAETGDEGGDFIFQKK